MDKFSLLTTDEKFSKLTLKVADHPKSLVHWENLLNYLITVASPLDKALDNRLYRLIQTTYESLLFHFPFLENYYIDYALFEYKLGHIAKVHKIYQHGLHTFNERSLLLWISYLKLCNEIVVNQKQLFKKYEMAEQYIGLHFFSGEFWELYLEQILERCTSKERYFIILRKVLEIPLHSFSKFFAMWLRCIDELQDLSQMSRLAPKEELLKKLKLDISYKGRRGPHLSEAKKLLKKFTKELYMVIQYQVLEVYSLFESNLSVRYYSSPETLISSGEIEIWERYLDYTVKLGIDSLTHLNFQRALLPLAHYDLIWIKYAHWLIDWKDDLITAKNVLLKGLSLSLRKTAILKLSCSVLCKLNEYDLIALIMEEKGFSYSNRLEELDDFEIFWDYIQFRIFCEKSALQSRYSNNQSKTLLPPEIFDIIMKRLSFGEAKEGQEVLLSSLIQLQNKENTKIIEEKVFKRIIELDWKYYLKNGTFWSLYCRLIFLDASRSYLEKRRYIVTNIWKQAHKFNDQISSQLQEFCQSYLPEDMDTLEDIFETDKQKMNTEKKK